MERSDLNYYLIESNDYTTLNRIWDWCNYQGRTVAMYKTRITIASTGWVVELADSKIRTAFLLNFSQQVTSISKPYYH